MKIKCKVCGCEFNPIKERHYISRDCGKTGFATVLGSNNEEKLYDTFDCVDCGSQVIAQERKRVYENVECVVSMSDDCDKEDEDEVDEGTGSDREGRVTADE